MYLYFYSVGQHIEDREIRYLAGVQWNNLQILYLRNSLPLLPAIYHWEHFYSGRVLLRSNEHRERGLPEHQEGNVASTEITITIGMFINM